MSKRKTPLEAVRAFCVECAGGIYQTQECGGDKCLGGQGDENNACHFYPFRQGTGRIKLAIIRRMCMECMGNSSEGVDLCPSEQCALYNYRKGKNPFHSNVGKPPKKALEALRKRRI